MNKIGKLSQKASIGLVLIFAGAAIVIVKKEILILGLIFVGIGIYLISRE